MVFERSIIYLNKITMLNITLKGVTSNTEVL